MLHSLQTSLRTISLAAASAAFAGAMMGTAASQETVTIATYGGDFATAWRETVAEPHRARERCGRSTRREHPDGRERHAFRHHAHGGPRMPRRESAS